MSITLVDNQPTLTVEMSELLVFANISLDYFTAKLKMPEVVETSLLAVRVVLTSNESEAKSAK